jgi:DNA-binding TFAR19-related protein (PDSD5 family)
MADPELAKIREARLQQLQQNAPTASTGEGGDEAAKRRAEEEMRRDLLATVLDSAARERRTSPHRTDVCTTNG